MHKSDTEPQSLLTWRTDALNLLLRVIVLVGLPGLPVALFLLTQGKQIELAAANLFGYILLCIIYFRHLWSAGVRTLVLLGIIYLITLRDLWTSGISGVGPIYIVAFCTLSALLLSRRSAIISSVLCTVTLLTILAASSIGYHTTPMDSIQIGLDPSYQIQTILATLVASGVLTVVVFSLTNQLRVSLRLAETSLVVRKTMQDTLEQRVLERTAELNEVVRVNRYLVAAVNNMATGMIVTDVRQPDSPTLFINQAFTAITGYKIEDLQQDSYLMLQGPETDSNDMQNIKSAIATGHSIHAIVRNYRKDGSAFWNELVLSPVFDDSGQLVAYVGLQSDVSDRMVREAAILASEADYRTLALENERLYNAERKQTEQIETLRQASVIVAGTLDAEVAVDRILEQLPRVIPHDSASVQLRRNGFSEVFGCRGFANPHDVIGLKFPIADNVLHEAVYERGEAQLVSEALEHPGFVGLTNQVIRSWLGLPLIVQDKVIGLLTLDSGQVDNFNEEHMRIGALFASQVSIALDNTQRFQREVQAHQRLSKLQRAAREIAAQSTALGEIYAAIHTAVQQLMPADCFVISLIEQARDEITHVYLADHGKVMPAEREPLRGSFTDYMIRRNKTLQIDDFSTFNEHHFASFGDLEESASGLAVLLRGRTRILGVIFTQSYQPSAYGEDDPALLELLATHVATALENATLFAEVERLATTDGLTDLPNRRSFFARASQEISRAKRNGSPISMIMLDVDHFKRVNDTYGHYAGDQILREVATTCQNWLRPSDIAGRYGGEEIAIALPNTSVIGAEKVAEYIRREIAAIEMVIGTETIRVTASLGVSSSEHDELIDLSTLLSQADTALYDAKQAGRNQVCAYEVIKQQ